MRFHNEIRGLYAKSMSELVDVREADVPLAPLHATDVSPVEISAVRELLLGKPLSKTEVANFLTERLQFRSHGGDRGTMMTMRLQTPSSFQ